MARQSEQALRRIHFVPDIEFKGTVQEYVDELVTETFMRLRGRSCAFVCNYIETYFDIPDHWIT